MKDHVRRPFNVVFYWHDLGGRRLHKEEGVDVGGLTAGFYHDFWEELKEARTLLSKAADGDAAAYFINEPRAGREGREYTGEQLRGYRAVGLLMAKSVTEFFHDKEDRIQVLVPSDLAPSFLLDVLQGKEVTRATPAGRISTEHLIQDIEHIMGSDHFLMRVLVTPNYCFDGLTFEYATGKAEDAIKDVNEDNKVEFARTFVQTQLIDDRRAAVEAMRDGFSAINITEHLRAFSRADRQRFICGRETFTGLEVWDLVVFEDPVEYRGWPWAGWGTEPFCTVKLLLRKYLVERCKQDQLKTFLKFVAGCTSLPQNLSIKVYPLCETESHLPRGRTCFQELILPPYTTYEVLEAKFGQAFAMGMEFGMA